MSPSPGAENPFGVVVRDHEGWPVLVLTGDCDVATVQTLRRGLRRALARAPRGLVVDLSAATFLDAGCAGALLEEAANSNVVVAGLPAIVDRVLEVLDPDRRLAVYADVASAIRALNR